MLYVQYELADYLEIPKRNAFYLEPDQKYCLIRSKRAVNELLMVVFNNDRPTEYDDPYYGMTKTLEGEGAIRQ